MCISKYAAKFATELFVQVHTYQKYGVHYESGVSATQDVVHLAVLAPCIVLWSWAAGTAIARMLRVRSWWVALAFYIVVQDASVTYSVIRNVGVSVPVLFVLAKHLLPFQTFDLLIVPAMVWGLIRPNVRTPAIFVGMMGLALTASLMWTESWYRTAIQVVSQGAWTPAPWYRSILPPLVASLPVAYLVISPPVERNLH